MATLDHVTDTATNMSKSLTITSSSGKTITLDTDKKYIEKDIVITMIPQAATHTFAGGVLTANNPTFSQTNATTSSSNTAGVSVTATATSFVSKATWTLNQSGWIDKPSSATQIKDVQNSGDKTNTLYITGVTIGTSKNFNITVPNGSTTPNLTLNFAVDANGNVLVT